MHFCLEGIFDVLQFHQLVHDGVDGEACRGMYLEFAGDVAPVGDDGVDGEVQFVGNGLVSHALHHAGDNLLFALAKRFLFGVLAFVFGLEQAVDDGGHGGQVVADGDAFVVFLQGIGVDDGTHQGDVLGAGMMVFGFECLQVEPAAEGGVDDDDVRGVQTDVIVQCLGRGNLDGMNVQVRYALQHGGESAADNDRGFRHYYFQGRVIAHLSVSFLSAPRRAQTCSLPPGSARRGRARS